MIDLLERLDEQERERLLAAAHPKWREPVLAKLTDQRFSDREWLFERKFDGERALTFRRRDRVRLLSRNRRPLNGSYPELVDALAGQRCDDFVVDGEVVAFEGRRSSFTESPFVDEVRDPSVTFVQPKLVAEVGFTEWTAEGRLRHPCFLGLRRDKRPEEVGREQVEA